MRFFFLLAIFFISNLYLHSQPVTQTERNAGLEPKMSNYIYSETFTGSDSAWINSVKRKQVFDESERLKEFEQEKWDSTGWIKEMRWELTYSGDLVTNIRTLSWIDESWKESGKSEMEYDGSQRIISNSNYYKNEQDEWILATKTISSYDEQGRVFEIIVYRNQGAMPDTTKLVHTYDTAGNLVVLLNQKFRNGIWVNDNITEFFYKDGKYIGQEFKFWYGTELLLDNMDSVFYDENDRIISRVHYKSYDDEYELDYHYLWTYDNNNRIIEEIYQDWLAIDWGDPAKTTITYDANGSATEKHKMQFRNEQWNEKEISYLTYNSYNQLTDFSYYIWLVGDWLRNTKMTYEFAEVGVETNRIEDIGSMNFPNPFSNETIIRFYLKESADVNISVFDISGNLIKSVNLKKLNSGEQQYRLNSGNLSSGIYIYRIDIGDEQYFNSFVLNK